MSRHCARWQASVLFCLLVCALAPFARGSAPPPPGAPEYHISVLVDLAGGRYEGRQSVRYANRSARPVRDLYFHLYPNVGLGEGEGPLLKVTSVSIDGRAAARHDDGSGVQVRLPAELRPGRAVEVALEFEGRAVRREAEDVDLGAHVTDQVGVVLAPTRARPRRGSDLVTCTPDAMLLGSPFPVLATSEGGKWRGRARASVGDFVFSEAAVYRIEVTAPPGVNVVASGESGAATGPRPGERVFAGAGLRSVALFASSGLVEDVREMGGMRLRSLHRAEHETAARRALDALAGATRIYADLFGPPPFDGITLVEAPLAPGTPGLAFSGLIALASAYYTDVRGEEGRTLPGFIRDTPDLMDGALEFEAMHQAAHQWWGESVGSDPQRTPFLDEALASYSAVAAIERLKGAEARERAVEQQLRTPYRVFRMFGGRDEPVQSPTDRFPNYFGYGAIIQGKGGMWFAALRERLGDERFFDGLRRYYAARGGEIARPRDLVEALTQGDQAAREQVDRLYERWIQERHGDEDVATPEYAVQVPAGVADGMSGKSSVFERFGRFVVRKMAQFGKTAAKPF